MAKTFGELQALALQIRDEVLEKKNTAPRVGAALLDMIDNTIQNITDINQKLSVFEHACSGFKRVESESQLPVTPPEDEKAVGYLVGKNLYLYVGKDGNAVNGRYFNVGDITGPQGEIGPQGRAGEKGEKGEQGNSGVSGSTDNIEVVNNLDGGESTPERIKVLAAEQGKVLNAKFSELGNKFNRTGFTDNSEINTILKEIYISGDNTPSNIYVYQIHNNDGQYIIALKDATDGSGNTLLYYSSNKKEDYIVKTQNNITYYLLVDWSQVNGVLDFSNNGNKLNNNIYNLTNSPYINAELDINNPLLMKVDEKQNIKRYAESKLLDDIIKELYIYGEGLTEYSNIYLYQIHKNYNQSGKNQIYFKAGESGASETVVYGTYVENNEGLIYGYNENKKIGFKAIIDWNKVPSDAATEYATRLNDNSYNVSIQ